MGMGAVSDPYSPGQSLRISLLERRHVSPIPRDALGIRRLPQRGELSVGRGVSVGVKKPALVALLCALPVACISAAYPAGDRAISVPGPIAFPCTNDSACGLTRCNTDPDPDGRPYNKCAFPCVDADFDCAAGAACLAGFCIPKPEG